MAKRKIDQLKDDVLATVGPLLKSWGAGDGMAALSIWVDRMTTAHDALQAHLVPLADSAGQYVEGSPETSRNAALSILPMSGSTRRRVLDEVYSTTFYGYVGLTDEALEQRLKIKHQTLSSARNHLVNAGWLMDSGKRAVASSKRPQVAWTMTPAAVEHLRTMAARAS